MNAALHAAAWTLNGRGLQRELPFYLGEPVMMTRNDYGRGLFNGDQGIVLKVRRKGEVHREAVFLKEEGLRAYPLGAIAADLVLAYAFTVHKAQGSEFDAVAVILPEGDHPLLTRQNLYTALTRARAHALLVGDPALPPLASRKEERRATVSQSDSFQGNAPPIHEAAIGPPAFPDPELAFALLETGINGEDLPAMEGFHFRFRRVADHEGLHAVTGEDRVHLRIRRFVLLIGEETAVPERPFKPEQEGGRSTGLPGAIGEVRA